MKTPKSETESFHQAALFKWRDTQVNRWPELEWMHHIANGGSRGDDARSRAIRGAQMKAQGVKTGIPDVFLPVKRGAYSGLYIELKKPSLKPVRAYSKGGVTEEQAAFREFSQAQGFLWTVFYSWEDAASMIVKYLAIV